MDILVSKSRREGQLVELYRGLRVGFCEGGNGKRLVVAVVGVILDL